MFDNIVCDMPLPGTVPKWIRPGHQFQTKDTPEQYLCVYRIGDDEELYGPDGKKESFTGDIEFYTSNICGCGPGKYTSDGADGESVTFYAHVVGGRVQKLEQIEYSIEPALPSSKQFAGQYVEAPPMEPLVESIGKKLYVWWGGQDSGYEVEIVAFNDHQTVVRTLKDCKWTKAGRLEILHQGGWGVTVFPDKETAIARNKARTDDWAARLKEYDDYVAEWRKRRAN
jgi:hypothetical protein